ncbi:membrane dipeptidase [Parvularcula sp. ZS-1/3]|uniref:Membrane dipeptidase n=1 Tax=Parvularcula mediterranea TaxID=2732508 RepID=A0A7Y3W444_9PROT|nr:dipeptidase [Parvularcula mediterranea]NNU15144.1 membrane dipeptidase [Parvularcula mediterranea]
MLHAILLTTALTLQPAPSEDAVRIAKETIILDGHVDVPYRVARSGEDVGLATEKGDFDYPRAMAGGLNAPFMSIYVAATYQETGGAKAQADRLIGQIEGLVHAHPDKFAIAKSPRDVRKITASGKIALPLGMENGAPIEGDIGNLKHFYNRGIRYITLTHSKVNHISDSSYDEERRWGGLSPFGAMLVERMNALGIMVDVSHVSDEAFEDIMEVTKAPVIASHSSLRHFTPGFERNMSDDMVRKLGENGGVIMINYGSSFVTEEANTYRARGAADYAAYLEAEGLEDTPERQAAFTEQWTAENPYPFADLSDVLDHIDRAVELAGIDHVGLGSDYDGVGDSLPTGLKDASTMPNLVQGLMERGYSEEDIVKILSGNALRVWEEVERVARRTR